MKIKIIIWMLIILGLVTLGFFVFISKHKEIKNPYVSSEVLNANNEVTMQAIMIDESGNGYATIWFTPSQRVYTLAKDLPNYKMYISFMKESIKDHSLLTVALNESDSTEIIKIEKASQEEIDYNNNSWVKPIE